MCVYENPTWRPRRRKVEQRASTWSALATSFVLCPRPHPRVSASRWCINCCKLHLKLTYLFRICQDTARCSTYSGETVPRKGELGFCENWVKCCCFLDAVAFVDDVGVLADDGSRKWRTLCTRMTGHERLLHILNSRWGGRIIMLRSFFILFSKQVNK